jgi:hypothetical protein
VPLAWKGIPNGLNNKIDGLVLFLMLKVFLIVFTAPITLISKSFQSSLKFQFLNYRTRTVYYRIYILDLKGRMSNGKCFRVDIVIFSADIINIIF